MDDTARLLAVEVLLADPETLGNDALETDLYILRDQLRAAPPPQPRSLGPELPGVLRTQITALTTPNDPARLITARSAARHAPMSRA
jgi:hypothetical protein